MRATRGTQLRSLLPRAMRRRLQASLIYLGLLVLLLGAAVGVYRGGVHLARLTPEQITLDELPGALTLSLIRVSSSTFISLVFAIGAGLAAARTRLGERVIIPALDILQSVPIVGFFPTGVLGGGSSSLSLGLSLARNDSPSTMRS